MGEIPPAEPGDIYLGSRSIEFGVVGVVVLGVYLVLCDTQGVAEFTVSNRFFD